jgi:NhaA family Na+:H+ antiporter
MTRGPKNALQVNLESAQGLFSSFVHAQRTSSLFLLFATVLALWWANSEYASGYHSLADTAVGLNLGEFQLRASLKHIINDGLMVVFFFLLGLEIKRELLAGDLARAENRRMLILCAVGGMAGPAIVYLLFNGALDSQVGWGIPIATDTAFALGVLALVRKHVPQSLLAFLVGLAIVDDLGAIAVIAVFYAQDVSLEYLAGAGALIAVLALGNYAGVRNRFFYIGIGVGAWWMMLNSGVHATLAGVAIAFTVPARAKKTYENPLVSAKRLITSIEDTLQPIDVLGSRLDHKRVVEIRDFAEHASTPLRRWEDALELPVALAILPLFVLTNAGISFSIDSFLDSLQHPVGLGIVSGLVLGKLIGISGACWLGLRYRIGCLPKGVNFQHVVGLSLIAGIGFTMSTFIATLGFETQPEHLQSAKSSILAGSLLAAILGVAYLRFVAARTPADSRNDQPAS